MTVGLSRPDRTKEAPAHCNQTDLTERQQEVLLSMAQGERNAEIARALFVPEGTVKTHVHSILQKLGAEDRTQAVVWAFRHGLVD